MNIKPYFSIDIETTGLDRDKAEILEIGCVYDDGVSPIEELKKFTILVIAPLQYVESNAIIMNVDLLKEIYQKPNDRYSTGIAIRKLVEFILSCDPSGKAVKFAGANAASFDLPILKREGLLNMLVHHRVIDVGSAFFKYFGHAASTCEIAKLIGKEDIYKHRALDDALFVVHALRWLQEQK